MKKVFLILLLSFPCLWAEAQLTNIKDKTVRENFEFADKQLRVLVNDVETYIAEHQGTKDANRVSPGLLLPDGSIQMDAPRGWRSGFFPGMLWYMYEMTKDDFWKEKAQKFTAYLEEDKTYTGTHDLGFIMFCSYGNGLRLTRDKSYPDILLETSRSLITRYKPNVGCIQSWNANKKWSYPVIIDNMMNLELLFWASKQSGDKRFRDIAVSHADNTIKNHFRSDYSSYHVVNYNVDGDGKANLHQTHQGYADDSSWARGQAWGLYGYTMCYRETNDKKYLEQAEHIAAYILNHPSMPKDMVTFWDFNAPDIPKKAPRDVSAAAIMASALYELSTMSAEKGTWYKECADKIVSSITKKFRSKAGKNHGFLTFASTGNYPTGKEIDTPIIYADYYFLEALVRKERIETGRPVVLPVYANREANYDEMKVPTYTLPDALTMNDGTRVTTVDQWEKQRRPELLEMFTREMFGKAPGKPADLRFEELYCDKNALGGKATRKEIKVIFNAAGDNYMKLLIYLPNNAKGAVPMFLGINFKGNWAINSDPGILLPTEAELARYGEKIEVVRGAAESRWDLDLILGAGYGLATFYRGDVDPDNHDEFQNGVHPLFYANGQTYPKADEWGTIAAWAWGLSRALDYMETDAAIDAKRVAVFGHSRLGKTALWAGAVDTRFAVMFSNESGCGGAALSRRAFGETLLRINTNFPHWFCENFKKYSDNESTLPFDQHELIALSAPRPVGISSAENDQWSDPMGEALSAQEAKAVYRLWGNDKAGNVDYYVRRGKHDVTSLDWAEKIKFADRFLK